MGIHWPDDLKLLAQLSEFTKKHATIHLEEVNLVLYQPYFNEVVFKEYILLSRAVE